MQDFVREGKGASFNKNGETEYIKDKKKGLVRWGNVLR